MKKVHMNVQDDKKFRTGEIYRKQDIWEKNILYKNCRVSQMHQTDTIWFLKYERILKVKQKISNGNFYFLLNIIVNDKEIFSKHYNKTPFD